MQTIELECNSHCPTDNIKCQFSTPREGWNSNQTIPLHNHTHFVGDSLKLHIWKELRDKIAKSET